MPGPPIFSRITWSNLYSRSAHRTSRKGNRPVDHCCCWARISAASRTAAPPSVCSASDSPVMASALVRPGSRTSCGTERGAVEVDGADRRREAVGQRRPPGRVVRRDRRQGQRGDAGRHRASRDAGGRFVRVVAAPSAAVPRSAPPAPASSGVGGGTGLGPAAPSGSRGTAARRGSGRRGPAAVAGRPRCGPWPAARARPGSARCRRPCCCRRSRRRAGRTSATRASNLSSTSRSAMPLP